MAVLLRAAHFCMMMRGIEKQAAVTETSFFTGEFRDSAERRAEFLAAVRSDVAGRFRAARPRPSRMTARGRILVTGATGYVGGRLLAALEQGRGDRCAAWPGGRRPSPGAWPPRPRS